MDEKCQRSVKRYQKTGRGEKKKEGRKQNGKERREVRRRGRGDKGKNMGERKEQE